MKPGDIVMWRSRATPTGLPVDMGPSSLIRKIGTVEDFWLLQSLVDGRIVRAFVYPEDFLKAGPGPVLTIIDGGKID